MAYLLWKQRDCVAVPHEVLPKLPELEDEWLAWHCFPWRQAKDPARIARRCA